MQELLLHCRPGFEGEAAAEMQELAGEQGIAGYPVTQDGSALVRFVCPEQGEAEQLMRAIDFQQLIFTRQWAVGSWLELDPEDRVSPIITACAQGHIASLMWLETADTNDGKALAALTKKLKGPLERSLTKTRFVRPNKPELPRLHLCFQSGHLFRGFNPLGNQF